ncbi:GMC family oxidoreductase N-terminal domain-containing protein [Nocardioides panacisoli]|uniref:GMC family oxidoreductase n=1 Tax=Nocardioides panacisoli TaxID=627624 RepID=UPI001C637750|nr:GMC family oxidoreductase N-terminal domain-containing protein [Nocardioides panacisoli]QYJ05359.1 GMC family oxidoreductase N-terminal domain-containing protein [Nocardioides panacisoli]
MSETYDYIVVGSGSGGAVVAGRLSEDPGVSVLVLEAGGRSRPHMNVQVPAAFAKQFKTDLDWEFYTEPEPHLDGREIYQPRGKMLGGCSGMNAQMWVRGNRSDYDNWAKAGATGWSYDEVLPLYKRAEHHVLGPDEHHGGSGPLHIEYHRSLNPASEQLLDGMVETGLERIDNYNGERQEGVAEYQVTQKSGQRWTTYDGYLRPHRKRPNLTIRTGAFVRRVLLAGDVATGVEVEIDGTTRTVHAAKEVILAAGAYQTPQLLMLSGIGPADHLREHGIEVVVDNDHVGAHLMDHPLYCVNYETSATGTLFEAEKPKSLLQYLTTRKGLLTSNVGEVGGFFHTRDGDEAPYMQLIAGPVYFWQGGTVAYEESPVVCIGLSMVGAESEGRVSLASADPHDKPKVRHNYFAERSDMDAMVTGIERAREVFATNAVKGSIGKEVHPGPGVGAGRDEVEAEIRRNVTHTFHPSCTARMGTEDDGVLGADLRVHGVRGLRVVDASAMPRITHGNTHAPTVLIGEKAADMIRTGSRA